MDAKRFKLFHVCKRREVKIMDLPMVIMAEIISRLPIKSIFRCKCVCKCWYNLPSDPVFVNLYHSRSPFPCLLLCVNDFVSSILELKAHYDYKSEPPYRPITLFPKFNFGVGFLEPELKLIGSCNGFICLLNGKPDCRWHSVYLSNPLLGEYFELELPVWGTRFHRVVYGFCFNEASGQYKVLRSVTRNRKRNGGPEVDQLEVCTVGVDKKWRNVGEYPHLPYESFDNVTINGSLHWIHGLRYERISTFDSGTEKVKSLPSPPGLKSGYRCGCPTLVELWNCLCWTERVEPCSYVAIWRMKEYGIYESWTKCYHISGAYITRPLLIWKDGEILMQSEYGEKLFSYSPKEKQFRKVKVRGIGRGSTRYVPSFYSLKTVIGKSFQVSNVCPIRLR